MKIFENPSRDKWQNLCKRNLPDNADITLKVNEIINAVKSKGDDALYHFAKEFDRVSLLSLKIDADEIKAAEKELAPELKLAIHKAKDNIEKFHKAQQFSPITVEVMPGVTCCQKALPINRIGLYIPGGRAPLFSTVLMLAVPAKIAGCNEIALFTPKSEEFGIAPEILYTASICGVNEVYAIGGAQAVAAMAYGTQSIARVLKIFGPGNRFVTKAKQLVADTVAIDMPAGPSEVLVMADTSADVRFIATDLLSQAEHGPDSQSILVCNNIEIARKVFEEVNKLSETLPRKDIIGKSLSGSRILVFDNQEDMIGFVNLYAPEHLIISMENPWKIADKITAAGSVFIGNYSPESAGDYASGTNHTLPTSGWAASYSGLNLDSFMHKITYQQLTKDGLETLASTITTMAEAEHLDAHALAVRIRTDNA